MKVTRTIREIVEALDGLALDEESDRETLIDTLERELAWPVRIAALQDIPIVTLGLCLHACGFELATHGRGLVVKIARGGDE